MDPYGVGAYGVNHCRIQLQHGYRKDPVIECGRSRTQAGNIQRIIGVTEPVTTQDSVRWNY